MYYASTSRAQLHSTATALEFMAARIAHSELATLVSPSLSPSSSAAVTTDISATSTDPVAGVIDLLELERADPQQREFEIRRRELLGVYFHDRMVAREICAIPENEWIATGDDYARSYSYSMESTEVHDLVSRESFNLCFKGLLVEDENQATLGVIGFTICDSNYDVLFKASKPLVVAEVQERGEVAELEALIQGLEFALLLGLKRITYHCDDHKIYLYLTGKQKAIEAKIAELVDSAEHLRKRFSDCHPAHAIKNDQSQSIFELPRSSIVKQSGIPIIQNFLIKEKGLSLTSKTEALGVKEYIQSTSNAERIQCRCGGSYNYKKRKRNPNYTDVRLKVKQLAEKKKVRLKVKRFAEKKYVRLNRLAEKNKWRRLVIRCYHMAEFVQGCNIYCRGGGHVLNQLLAKLSKEKAQYVQRHPLQEMPMNPLQVPSTLDRYQSILEYCRDGDQLNVTIPSRLFHYDESFDIPIGKDEIERWLHQDEIEACHVSVYIRYLVENHCAGVGDMFGFLCPSRISPGYDGGSLENRAKYVASAMEGNIHNKSYFGPYNPGGHWVLIVFNPQFDHAYWIDPHRGQIHEDAMRLVEMSHTMKYAELGERKPRLTTLWHRIECPLQNMVDCGYHVLRFMREIINRRDHHIPHNWYDHKTKYTQRDIDEIRTEWMEFVFGLEA